MKNKFRNKMKSALGGKIYRAFTSTPKSLVSGFTIIELLIVIFIFSTVMIMASSSFATSYISGRTNSSSSMEANRSLSLVLDIIGQKMANANEKVNFSSTWFFGFRVVSESVNPILVISSRNSVCSFFVKDGGKIKMLQNACTAVSPTDFSAWETISSPNINITTFDLTQKNQCINSPCASPPYITIKITGTDTKTGGKATLQSTYSIPAYTYNKW